MSLSARFWSKVDVSGSPAGCWTWRGPMSHNGYPRWSGKSAYRLAYEESFGPVPVGMECDHLCRTKECVNPLHIEAVSHAENCHRARAVPGHGSASRYGNQGCRCPECRTAWAAKCRAQRAKRRSQ